MILLSNKETSQANYSKQTNNYDLIMQKQIFNYIAKHLLWPLALYLSLSMLAIPFAALLFLSIYKGETIIEKCCQTSNVKDKQRSGVSY